MSDPEYMDTRVSHIPRVTVLMPIHNAARHVAEAVDSILGQDFRDFELLIIDDGSVDESVAVVQSFDDPRIRLERNKRNLGLVATLNRGLELARGEYVARMDGDDISLPGRLAAQVAFLDTHPLVGVCGTQVRTFGERTATLRLPTEPAAIQTQLLVNCCLAHPSVMLRKQLCLQHGLRYDAHYLHAEDWALWQRASFLFPLANLDQVLLEYRVSSSSVSSKHSTEQRATERRLVEENLARLGMNEKADHERFHHLIRNHEAGTPRALAAVGDLLHRLVQANQEYQLYPEPAFTRFMAGFWRHCSSRSTLLGLSCWRVYRRSRLRKSCPAVFGVKLLLKSLLRWRRKEA